MTQGETICKSSSSKKLQGAPFPPEPCHYHLCAKRKWGHWRAPEGRRQGLEIRNGVGTSSVVNGVGTTNAALEGPAV